jgi:uncharacterized membrane protein YeiB
VGYCLRRLLWLMIFCLVNAYLFLCWGDVLFKVALPGLLLLPGTRFQVSIK